MRNSRRLGFKAWLAFASLLAWAFVAPASVQAQEEGHGGTVIIEDDAVVVDGHEVDAVTIVDDGHGEAAAYGEEHGGGMPQLDAASYPSQILWLIISFGLLYWLLKSRGLPRVAEILETRQERLDSNLEKAAKLRADAEEAYANHERVVADARAKAGDDIKAMRDRVEAENAERQRELEADLDAKIKEAEARVAEARRQALSQVDAVASDVTSSMVERLIGQSVPENDVRAAVEAAKREVA